MNAIEAGETILHCIEFIRQSRIEHNDKQGELDKQLCDLYHQLEFTSIDIQRGYKIAKQIQDVLKERRQVKNEQEVLSILYNRVIESGGGKKFTNDLTAHLGGAKKRQSQLKERVYTPRSQAFKEKEES